MQPHADEALTLSDKLWLRHLVDVSPDGEALLYVDRHLVYEVTSPQAFFMATASRTACCRSCSTRVWSMTCLPSSNARPA